MIEITAGAAERIHTYLADALLDPFHGTPVFSDPVGFDEARPKFWISGCCL